MSYMTMSIMAIPNSLIILSLMSFFMSRKKVLMAILSLEFLLLNTFFMMIVTLSTMNQPLPHSIFLLVLGACEATLGLSLLINMTRFKSNDLLTKNTLKF